MNMLVYGVISLCFFDGYIIDRLPPVFKLIPEILSAAIALLVLTKITAERFMALQTKYVILAIFTILHIITGIIVNFVAPGVILSGLRQFAPGIALFLLPMAYRFSQDEIFKQLKLILYFSLFQIPVTLYQRLVKYQGFDTGDVVTGTLGAGTSGALSVLLVSVVAVVITLYVRKKISSVACGLLTVALLIPTTINETKVTVVLLPIAVFIPFLVASSGKITFSQLATGILGSAVLIGGFTIGYQQFYHHTLSPTQYLYSGKDIAEKQSLSDQSIGVLNIPSDTVGTTDAGGRLDKIILPLQVLSSDPIKLWLGYGIGNVSNSIIGKFSGEYASALGKISGQTLLSSALWNFGIGGAVLVLVFQCLILQDAYYLWRKHRDDNVLIAAWIPVTLIQLIVTPYLNIFNFNVLIFLFNYLSGYVAAERFHCKYSFRR